MSKLKDQINEIIKQHRANIQNNPRLTNEEKEAMMMLCSTLRAEIEGAVESHDADRFEAMASSFMKRKGLGAWD
tara:strand:+ start:982 stop:1203 length:222 start_codon:yes stop_codon:yes gene_type:complete